MGTEHTHITALYPGMLPGHGGCATCSRLGAGRMQCEITRSCLQDGWPQPSCTGQASLLRAAGRWASDKQGSSVGLGVLLSLGAGAAPGNRAPLASPCWLPLCHEQICFFSSFS